MQENDLQRPADVCRALLAALDAADGRRKQRKRDQTPDRIGLTVKRELLERVVAEDPDPGSFESWLFTHVHTHEGTPLVGAVSAMVRAIFDEWRLAHDMRDFAAWLARGAPSDDARR